MTADAVFNIALTSDDADATEITKLYLANNDEFSQGSSIYLEKENVSEEAFSLCLGIQPSRFFADIQKYLSETEENYSVLLRLNCEGAEDSDLRCL